MLRLFTIEFIVQLYDSFSTEELLCHVICVGRLIKNCDSLSLQQCKYSIDQTPTFDLQSIVRFHHSCSPLGSNLKNPVRSFLMLSALFSSFLPSQGPTPTQRLAASANYSLSLSRSMGFHLNTSSLLKVNPAEFSATTAVYPVFQVLLGMGQFGRMACSQAAWTL